jgi:uncharacterized protein (UPF0548 family)
VLRLSKPDPAAIRAHLEEQSREAFSYREVGATRAANLRVPAVYQVDHYRARLGAGRAAFERASEALRHWAMFGLPWVALCPPDAPIAVGATVGVLAHLGPLWSLNACRIVYTLEEAEPVRRRGFAYGTLRDHAASGEERFSVEWLPDGSVWYDLLVFSRPGQFFSRVGRPYTRRLQRRFAAGSLHAMRRAVARPAGGEES